MKISIVVTTYNRPAYLKQCLDSLKRSDLKGAEVIIIDDGSTDKETLNLIRYFSCIACFHKQNVGVVPSLLRGFQLAFKNTDSNIVINLDSDAIVRNDWLDVLLNLHAKFPDKIITGFHSTTKNRDGSERHKMIRGGLGWCEKLSVGGINMLFTKETFTKYAEPALQKCLKGGNWDHQTSLNAGSVICCVPSVVQHIGIESSLGHIHDLPDVADDFKGLHLPNVTLVCVDDRPEQAEKALQESIKNIQFADIVYLNKHLGSKEAYSKFILKELYKHIITDYALIVQHDGYVKNWQAWTDEFLKYDYIGAPWWYKDDMNVGNGGFSLRSKKLLQLTAYYFTIHENLQTHPEDHVICRIYRSYFESAGIKFAPVELAKKFSFEGYLQPGTYTNQFGFHGQRALKRPPDPKKQGFIINQFLGLGDILFLVPLVRKWIEEGHDIIWPIADEYFDIKENFPDIQFVKKSKFPMNYESRTDFLHRFQWGIYKVRSLRWNMCKTPQEAMTSKYDMVNEDWHMWRQLSWTRNYEKEKALAILVHATGKYQLNCTQWGNENFGGVSFRYDLESKHDLKTISLHKIPGFTLLDWAGVIENASEIHAVSSSTFYLFEILNLKAKKVHLYSRKLGKRDFEYIENLMTKNYKIHL